MSTHNIYFLHEIRKNVNFRASWLVGKVDFDHLLVNGQRLKVQNPGCNDSFCLFCI